MGLKVNIGGDRLGSGSKMNVELHNYYRSTHNLSKNFKTSAAPGVLYPCYVNVGLNGDNWEIDIKQIMRTLPTQGPLFSTFKGQIDFFVCPIRLYQGILHNNALDLGMKMNQVYMPKAKLDARQNFNFADAVKKGGVQPSSIWKYLGLSGVGLNALNTSNSRNINAVPLLAYYDIFKNYYANKQEDNAYVCTTTLLSTGATFQGAEIDGVEVNNLNDFTIDAGQKLYIYGEKLYTNGKLNFSIYSINDTNLVVTSYFGYVGTPEENSVELRYDGRFGAMRCKLVAKTSQTNTGLRLQEFPLKNIDDMRYALLSKSALGEQVILNDLDECVTPYYDAIRDYYKGMQGLCVKTYQSDLFNNWLKTDLISGENGIAAITRVDTTNGLTMDALNLAQKVYNMLNRIAVSGGTYEDWQDAVYTQSKVRKAESPIYVGGASTEIYFEEVLATTSAEDQALGSMGGRGRTTEQKGGHIEFDIEEPSFIIGILSLTPRVTYSQGNKWYLTDLDTLDDLHKPALDGIGFQDLMVEQMAWWDTTLLSAGQLVRHSAGKVPAWINYMTDVDECFGDFASDEGTAYMVLNRNYEVQENAQGSTVKDITTYIDPSKFNYAFAFTELTAQNFWVEIQFDIKTRRLMSAKQIPNL